MRHMYCIPGSRSLKQRVQRALAKNVKCIILRATPRGSGHMLPPILLLWVIWPNMPIHFYLTYSLNYFLFNFQINCQLGLQANCIILLLCKNYETTGASLYIHQGQLFGELEKPAPRKKGHIQWQRRPDLPCLHDAK